MNKKLLLSITLSVLFSTAHAQVLQIDLQEAPKNSPAALNVNLNRNKNNSDLIKLITLDGMSSTESITDVSTNKNSFSQYFISGDDKFAQANITSAYSDYTKAVAVANNNDFQALLAAYKLANLGFFTLSQQALNQIKDSELFLQQTTSIKNIFFPSKTLSYDEEILLAELYADIYYNNLAKETAKELNKNHQILKKSDYANYILAQAYFESGEYNRAMNAINKALNIKKDSLFYLQYKAKILCEAKNYNDALKILTKISSSGFIIDSFNHVINVQKEYTLANAYKDTAKSKYHLAKYFFLIGEYNRAIKEVNNSISAKKKNYVAYSLLGDIHFYLGDYTKAKEAYNKALQFNKKYAPALKGIGKIEALTGVYETATIFYYQAQKYAKSDVSIVIEIAKLLNKTGEKENAKALCQAIALKAPNNSNLYYVMSEVYSEKQIEYLRKSLALNAFNNDAWIDLAEINLMHNNLEQAEKYLLSVKVSDRESFKYYYVEGLLNKYHGNVSAAAVSFKKSLKLNPNYSPAQKELNTLNL